MGLMLKLDRFFCVFCEISSHCQQFTAADCQCQLITMYKLKVDLDLRHFTCVMFNGTRHKTSFQV